MNEWPRVRVKDVCCLIVDCINRTAPIVDYETHYRMIRTTNIRNGRIDLSNCRYVDKATFKKWTRRAVLNNGDVILTREAPIGEVGYVKDIGHVFLGQRTMQYRADPDKIDPRYLFFAFRSPELQHQFGSHDGSGSVISHIRVADCHEFMVPLPPKKEQVAIGELLGSLDDKIDLNRRMNETLEAMARAIFKDWFVDFGPVRAKAEGRPPYLAPELWALFPDALGDDNKPVGWKIGKISELCKKVESGGTPSRKEPLYWNGGNIPWLTSGEVRQTIVTKTESFITEAGLENSSAKLWPPLATVVAMYGATAGQVTLLACETTANQACCALIPEQHTASYVFLKAINSVKIYEVRASGSAQQNLNKSIVSDLETIIPMKEILENFEGLVSSLIMKMIANERQNQTLAQTRDLLLPKLMSGKIRLREAEKIIENVL